ncbi:MAG: type I restriction enzyme HsdR N-terminal domain-containing protein [Paludibacteraceae bacterium]|nr:type I restriction enzyme HsdR N-terminal domain-containing protein [Paludibacteraceae bacterium]
MQYRPEIERRKGKDYILCEWRRKYVRLTPEEWVRQHFLHGLVEDFGYPQAFIAVEAPITVGEVQKRCDAIIYDAHLQPVCIVEFKAPTISLTQKVFDQVAVYNRRVGVHHFFLSNGRTHRACRVLESSYEQLPTIPLYTELCQNT